MRLTGAFTPHVEPGSEAQPAPGFYRAATYKLKGALWPNLLPRALRTLSFVCGRARPMLAR
jgi:hypothetical protein